MSCWVEVNLKPSHLLQVALEPLRSGDNKRALVTHVPCSLMNLKCLEMILQGDKCLPEGKVISSLTAVPSLAGLSKLYSTGTSPTRSFEKRVLWSQ